jgi:hypothetical protein
MRCVQITFAAVTAVDYAAQKVNHVLSALRLDVVSPFDGCKLQRACINDDPSHRLRHKKVHLVLPCK